MNVIKSKLTVPLLVLFLLLNILIRAQSNLSEYFPAFNTLESNNPSNGYFFLASPISLAENSGPYLSIIDNNGNIIFFRKQVLPSWQFSPYKDNHFVFFSGNPKKLYFMNETYTVYDSLKTIGFDLDIHEFALTDDNHIILMAWDARTLDMSEIVIGGNPSATVKDLIIQEFDENKQLLYSWNSKDYFNILDVNTESIYIDLTSSIIDYMHSNSIIADSDTSMLLSSRHMDEITKIDRRTGEIIWRLGGKNNEFEFINDELGFSHQHSLNKLANGNLLFFDNGNLHDSIFSSIVEYQIDEKSRTVSLVNRFRHQPDIFSSFLGFTQRMPNGNTIAGWGHEYPSFTEYNPDGSIALEMDFSSHSYSPSIFKYDWSNPWFSPMNDSLIFPIWEESGFNQAKILIENKTDSSILLTDYTLQNNFFEIIDTFPIELSARAIIPINVAFNASGSLTGFMKDILTIYSRSDNQIIGCQIHLIGTKQDTEAPTVTISPDSSHVPLDAKIQFRFSESIRFINNEELNYSNVDDLFDFKLNDLNGENVEYNANINTDKNIITITPNELLSNNQLYYISLRRLLEDYSDNEIAAIAGYFNTGSLLGIDEEADDSTPLIFPNPNRGSFFMKMNEIETVQLEIYNLSGELVSKIQDISSNHPWIHLDQPQAGMYIVLVKNKANLLLGRYKLIISN